MKSLRLRHLSQWARFWATLAYQHHVIQLLLDDSEVEIREQCQRPCCIQVYARSEKAVFG